MDQTTNLQWLIALAGFLQDIKCGNKARNSVITLNIDAGRRIGLGGSVKEKIAPFISLQEFDLAWFRQVPWSHAVLEDDAIVFIAFDKATMQETGPMGIRFPVNPDYTEVLSRFDSLEIREMKIDKSGNIVHIGERTSMSLRLDKGKVERLGKKPAIKYKFG